MRLKIISVLFLLIYPLWSINFRQTAFIPYGVCFSRVPCLDSDHDGRDNIILKTVSSGLPQVQYWEYRPFDWLNLEDSIIRQGGGLETAGWIDNDSLTDMIIGTWDTLRVFESPTINSHPTRVVWRWGEVRDCAKAAICDLDRDGKKEILATLSSEKIIVFENGGDNIYNEVFRDTLLGGAWCFTVGDFDLDGKTEIVFGQIDFGQIRPNVRIFECFGDNNYRKVFMDSLPTPNNHCDIFSGNDMDGNGKPEFLINSAGGGGGVWIMVLWLYESTGDNRYAYFCVDSIGPIPGRTEDYASLCADIDSDGKEEIIWAVQNNWLVYKAVGVHQYRRIFNAYPIPGGSGVDCTVLSSADFNGNGYPEIVESSYRNDIIPERWTKIWEIEGVRLHRPNGGEVLVPGSQFPIAWEKFTPPGADSFTLFISFDNGRNYQTITTIQQSNDTMYLWRVPDSLSDSCKIMIWAYGPPRAGENKPRGTAWDFSDSVFAIRQTGITEDTRYRILDTELKILQNPARSKNLKIQYSVPKTGRVKLAVYNALGQMEEIIVDGEVSAGIYEKNVNKKLPNGIYFVQFMTENKVITQKLIIIE